jgi:hypothetical protein
VGVRDPGSWLRCEAMSDLESSESNGLALGVFLLLVGTIAIVISSMMKVSGFTVAADPGPAALPRAAGVVLMLGGAFEIVRYALRRRINSTRSEAPATTVTASSTLKPGLMVLSLVIAYGFAIPLLGFSLATGGFAVALLRWFGAGWRLSCAVSLSLIIVITTLFTQVFEVVLPAGRLGLPF